MEPGAKFEAGCPNLSIYYPEALLLVRPQHVQAIGDYYATKYKLNCEHLEVQQPALKVQPVF